jgi:hypothetical protein
VSRFQFWPSLLALLAITTLLTGCDSGTSPSGVSRVTIAPPTPASGSTLVTTGTTPGAFIVKDSGVVSIPISIEAGRYATWAQLYVYLMTADGSYCGQNLPDAPTWGPLDEGQTASVTISGFQVFRLPCEVTGLRAMLHTRNSGLLTPPNASETMAEALLPVNYIIR